MNYLLVSEIQQKEKRKKLKADPLALGPTELTVMEGLSIKRTLLNFAQPHAIDKNLYEEGKIYLHFILDANIKTYDPKTLRTEYMNSNQIWQIVGGDHYFFEEGLIDHEFKLTFALSAHLIQKWRQEYQIPTWLAHWDMKKGSAQQVSLGRYHKRIMLLVERLLVMNIHSLSDRLALKSSVLLICAEIFQLHSIAIDADFVDEALTILHQNPLVKWNLVALAKKVGTNECYLKQAFKQKMGVSIGRYMKNIRMQEVLHLIMSQNMSAKEAAFAAGYTDVGYFSKIFKQQYGYTPSDLALK